jgi:predicted nuclease of predicted toxin-antitoxin system
VFGLGAATRIYLAVGSTDMCKGQDRTWWADDKTIWRYAADNGLLIVSRDSDFHGWSTLYGFPPKVIWLRTGNCSTEKIASLLQFNAAFIAEFTDNERDSLLVLH